MNYQTNVTNQTMMPGGDEDDIEEFPDQENLLDSNLNSKNNLSKSNIKQNVHDKFSALYDDARHRNLRQEHIYSKCIDKECTFKPELITKHSKISIKTVNDVKNEVHLKTNLTQVNESILDQDQTE